MSFKRFINQKVKRTLIGGAPKKRKEMTTTAKAIRTAEIFIINIDLK